MTKYILTSTSFTGQITFGFDINGRLGYYFNDAEMTQEQTDYLLKYIPIHSGHMERWRGSKTVSITVLPEDITWERFWETYDQKINAKRCKPLWEALNDFDKLMAIVRISHYKAHVKRKNIGMANPEKYLRDRYFDTDWLKIK